MKSRKYILIVLAFLTSLLCTVGASLWVVLSDKIVELIPYEKITPTVTAPTVSSAFYYGEEVTFAGTATANNTSINGTWSVDTKIATSGTSSTVATTTTCTFTPTQTALYESVSVSNVAVNMNTVASIDSTFYTTVDGALTAANNANSGTVYVTPLGYSLDTGTGKAVNAKTIQTTTTINSGVTLAIPYEGTTILAYTHGSTSLAFKKPASYLKNNVTLATNLTNNGYIQVGGYISGGTGASPYASFTTTKYAQLTLADGVTLTNKKTGEGLSAGIQCYGQITETTKGSSKGVVNNGGTLITPFTIRDHRGGSAYFAISGISKSEIIGAVVSTLYAKPDVTPFNKLYVPNITSPLKIENSGALYGYANLWANDDNQVTTMKLIGNDSNFMIQLSSGSYATADFDHETEITDLDIYGSATMNSMSLDLAVSYDVTSSWTVNANVSISTENALFPINWHFNVGLHKNGTATATVELKQHLRIMPGGSLTIDEGVTVNVTKMIIYDDTFEDIGTKTQSNTPYEETYPATSSLSGQAIPSGKLVVNGTLNATNLGGLVETTNTGATLNVSTSASVSSKEVDAVTGSGLDATASFYSVRKRLSVYPYNGSGIDPRSNADTGTYYSQSVGNNLAGWYSKTKTISYSANGGEFLNATPDDKTITSEGGYQLKDSDVPDSTYTPTREHYTFAGWKLNDTSPVGQTIYINVEIIATWTPIPYNLKYNYSFVDVPTIANPANTTYTVETNTQLSQPTYEKYVFDGWYLDAELTERITQLNGAELLTRTDILASDNSITLYGAWYPAGTGIYRITYVNTNEEHETPLATTVLSSKTSSYNTPTFDDSNPITHTKYFVGWYIDEECETTPFDKTNTAHWKENLTLYAKWANKVKATLNPNGGTFSYANVTYDKTLDIYQKPSTEFTLNPTRTGYDFAGWSIVGGTYDGQTKTGTLTSLSTTNGDTVTLTATWTPKKISIIIPKYTDQNHSWTTHNDRTSYSITLTIYNDDGTVKNTTTYNSEASTYSVQLDFDTKFSISITKIVKKLSGILCTNEGNFPIDDPVLNVNGKEMSTIGSYFVAGRIDESTTDLSDITISV